MLLILAALTLATDKYEDILRDYANFMFSLCAVYFMRYADILYKVASIILCVDKVFCFEGIQNCGGHTCLDITNANTSRIHIQFYDIMFTLNGKNFNYYDY